jgi:hypothetical protein
MAAAGFLLRAGVAKRAKSRGIPAEGAKPAAVPGFITPQLATLKSNAPTGSQGAFLHEKKLGVKTGDRLLQILKTGLSSSGFFALCLPRSRTAKYSASYRVSFRGQRHEKV